MNVLMISFDASKTNSTLAAKILGIIKAQPSWAITAPNTYLVVTSFDAAQMRNQLGVLGVSGLVVFNVTNQLWAAYGLPNDVSQWLQTNWRQS